MPLIAARFARVEPRHRARDLLLGLASDLPVKNCWTIAEHAGHKSPDGVQHLLRKAVWDHDAILIGSPICGRTVYSRNTPRRYRRPHSSTSSGKRPNRDSPVEHDAQGVRHAAHTIAARS